MVQRFQILRFLLVVFERRHGSGKAEGVWALFSSASLKWFSRAETERGPERLCRINKQGK